LSKKKKQEGSSLEKTPLIRVATVTEGGKFSK